MRQLLLAGVAALFAGTAHAQMVGVYSDAIPAFEAKVWAAPVTRLVYVDSTMQMSQFVQSAQYEAGRLAASSKTTTIPMLGLPMAGSGQDAGEAFRSIASGSQDAMIKGVLQAFADAGFQSILLRPGFEMNGGWFSWTVTEANAADFKKAFQRIAAISRDFKTLIVSLVFNPNVGRSIPLDDYFPGNAAVDVVALDSYGPPPAPGGPQPLDGSGSDTNLTVRWMMDWAKANNLPFGLCETGADHNDANFAAEMAQAVKAGGNAVLFAGFWSVNDHNGQMSMTDNPAVAASWSALAALINQGNGVVIASLSAQDKPPPVSVIQTTTSSSKTESSAVQAVSPVASVKPAQDAPEATQDDDATEAYEPKTAPLTTSTDDQDEDRHWRHRHRHPHHHSERDDR